VGRLNTQNPAQGSREVIDRELERQRQREQRQPDHVSGVEVSGQPQAGAAERGKREERIRARAYQIWEENGRPEGYAEKFWLQAEQEVDRKERG
jgi:hypothetical protein